MKIGDRVRVRNDTLKRIHDLYEAEAVLTAVGEANVCLILDEPWYSRWWGTNRPQGNSCTFSRHSVELIGCPCNCPCQQVGPTWRRDKDTIANLRGLVEGMQKEIDRLRCKQIDITEVYAEKARYETTIDELKDRLEDSEAANINLRAKIAQAREELR